MSEQEKTEEGKTQINSGEGSTAEVDKVIPQGDGANATLGTLTSGLNQEGGSRLGPAQTAEARKIGSFPSDLSTIKPIFGLKSKNT